MARWSRRSGDAGRRARGPVSRTWRVLRTVMSGPAGMVGAVGWGFAEAVSLPVTSEMYLVLVAAAHPRRVLRRRLPALGSVAGVLVTRALTARGERPPAPLTTSAMPPPRPRTSPAGARGIWRQALNGVPVKVYAGAGAGGVPAAALAAHALGARGARALVARGLAARGVRSTRPSPAC